MGFDASSPLGSRPTAVTDKSAGVGRAAAIYARRQPPPAPGALPSNPGPGDHHPHVSPMGRLLRDLHGLKSNDPNAFATVTASIATRLHEIATTEPEEVAERLDKLAERFSQASQTGNLASLRPSEQMSFRALRGPAAYTQQQQQEDRQEIRTEVRSAIDQVLSQYLVDAEPEMGATPTGMQTDSDAPTTPSLTVSA